MQEISKASTDNATASWYGFESQGRIGILYFLKRLNSLEKSKWDKLTLEYEYMEDFSIGNIDEKNKIVYESIYQVKARENLPKDDIKKVYGELGFKQSIYNDANVYLITRCKINEDINMKSEIEEYIDRHLRETELLYSYNDLTKIRENLNLKNSKSELQTIRKTVRNKFEKFNLINNVEEIKKYCEELMLEYRKYKKNIEERDINVIHLDFDEIDISICKHIKEIMIKIEPDKEYKQVDSYIEKVRNALIYLLSSTLENYVLGKNQLTFRVSSEKIIEVIKKDHSKIDELQYLYLMAEKLDDEFEGYCEDNCLEKEENMCDECALKKTIQKMRWINSKELKSMLLNSNPHIKVEELNYINSTKLIESSKLESFIFDEIKKDRYKIQTLEPNVYLKSINEKCLFSFIDYEENKKDFLLKKLDKNAVNSIHVYNDNESILNKNLNFKYNVGESLSINQHWDEEKIEEKERIISSSIQFEKFNS